MLKYLSEQKTYLLLALALGVNSCKVSVNEKDFLQKVLINLEQINSATYNLKSEGWAPGDTSAYAISYTFVKEYNNPCDSTIGASYIQLIQKDTSQLSFCYDGMMRAIVYEEDKTIAIDSFKVRRLPFRPLNPPFFNYAKNIIKYALETNDSISIESKEIKDTLLITFTIFEDKQVEFFGNAYYVENKLNNFEETFSKYEIWIDKSTNLPYRIRRDMSHDISVRTCYNYKLNKIKIEDFKASSYFQSGYSIVPYGKMEANDNLNILIGKIAPDWMLQDSSKKMVALSDLKSKVLLLQFTSVSCGPCKESIPFLNKLSTHYNKQVFDFVAIEAFAKNSSVIRHYQNKNCITYKFLMSTKDVTKNYKIKSVPVFFLLDKNRVIRKIINGYEAGATDIEIINAINELK